jgi:sugar diacid utilization regulator
MGNTVIPNGDPAFRYTVSLLSALSEPGRGLQDLLDIGYEILENPILIADKSWRAIAMTPHTEIPDDKSWNEFLKNGFLSPDAIASGIQDQLVEKIDTSKTLFKWLSADMKYPRLFGRIMLNGSTPAIISVLEYNRAITESDYKLIEILCSAAAAEFQKNEYQQYTRGTQYEDLFVNILEGRLRDPDAISKRVKVLNLKFNRYNYIFTVDVFDAETNQVSFAYLRDAVEKTVINAKAFIYGGHLNFVTSFSAEDTVKKTIGDLESFLKKFELRCGVSRRFEHLAELRVHYKQAMHALSVGHHMQPGKPVYFYNDYAIYHITKYFWDSGCTEEFIHPALKELIASDQKHNTDLVFTLNTYLKNFGNITNMSKIMNMHRNTIIYRLQRIEEIMKVSLSDHTAMEQIIFSLRLMEYKNGREA